MNTILNFSGGSIARKITYIGVDETSAPLKRGLHIVATAETTDPKLTEDRGYLALKKTGDYLAKAKFFGKVNQYKKEGIRHKFVKLPTFVEMQQAGVESYYWSRSNPGKLSRQMIEHATIANIVSSNGHKPESTVIMVDAFYNNDTLSKELIKESLHSKGFKIPESNIEIWVGGDQRIPIINYADIIAFHIVMNITEKYREYFPEAVNLPVRLTEIDHNGQRVETITPTERKNLEGYVNYLRRVGSTRKPDTSFIKDIDLE